MTARKRTPTPVAGTDDTTPDYGPAPSNSEQVDIDNLSLDEIVTTLEVRSMDVAAAIERLYAGTSDSPAGPATDTARATAIRDRVGDVVGELHESLKRIELFTARLGSPL